MTDQLWPHHRALGQRSSQRPLIESQCHRWHYWLDRLALGWKGLELLACCSLMTWPTRGGSLSFQIVSQNDRNLPDHCGIPDFTYNTIGLLHWSHVVSTDCLYRTRGTRWSIYVPRSTGVDRTTLFSDMISKRDRERDSVCSPLVLWQHDVLLAISYTAA